MIDRRLVTVSGVALLLMLAGCGNKGDLVKPGDVPPPPASEPAAVKAPTTP